MSATMNLTKTYAAILSGLTEFAAIPYILTVEAIIADAKCTNSKEIMRAALSAVLACVVFTFAIPILPLCTLLTLSLALVASSLAAVSALIAYPIALGIDLAEACVAECADTENQSFTL